VAWHGGAFTLWLPPTSYSLSSDFHMKTQSVSIWWMDGGTAHILKALALKKENVFFNFFNGNT